MDTLSLFSSFSQHCAGRGELEREGKLLTVRDTRVNEGEGLPVVPCTVFLYIEAVAVTHKVGQSNLALKQTGLILHGGGVGVIVTLESFIGSRIGDIGVVSVG